MIYGVPTGSQQIVMDVDLSDIGCFSMLPEDFKQKVSELGLPVQQKVWVEPMTLKAFAREQITSGNELPMDKLGVFVGSKTKLTKK